MTIEIHELIIQARIDDRPTTLPRSEQALSKPARREQEALIEQIAQRVLQYLRDEQEGWR